MAASGERYDAVFAFECIRDLLGPVAVLASMRVLAGDGTVIVMERAGGREVHRAPATRSSA